MHGALAVIVILIPWLATKFMDKRYPLISLPETVHFENMTALADSRQDSSLLREIKSGLEIFKENGRISDNFASFFSDESYQLTIIRTNNERDIGRRSHSRGRNHGSAGRPALQLLPM